MEELEKDRKAVVSGVNFVAVGNSFRTSVTTLVLFLIFNESSEEVGTAGGNKSGRHTEKGVPLNKKTDKSELILYFMSTERRSAKYS